MTMHQDPSRLTIAEVSTPMLRTAFARTGIYRSMGKRLLDLALIATMALPTALIVGLLALLVARDGASAFYKQERLGRNGRKFLIWKLRTMVPDADAALAAHLAADPEAKEEWDRTQKLRNDPRVTKIGRILRKTSLDELPQLWNVVLGDMSLVGPRPMMVNQRSLYPGTTYYNMRPGITGYWQTSGRNNTSFAARAQYDSAYYKDLSLRMDIWVLLRTVRVVIKGTGC